jgi:hypothetical protein
LQRVLFAVDPAIVQNHIAVDDNGFTVQDEDAGNSRHVRGPVVFDGVIAQE